MKNVFKKSRLPFIKKTLHEGSGRDNWSLARVMQDCDGINHQLPAEIALLNKGVQQGDVWSMCELARCYFNYCGDLFLPQSLGLWKRAILLNDDGAKYDISNFPILERILSYKSYDNGEYNAIEMKCAMLSEYHLTKFGLCPWECANLEEKKARCLSLIKDCCSVLNIPQITLEFIPDLTYNNVIIDGLAHCDYRVCVREAVLCDFERLIEVIFHELGHMVAFEILRGSDESEKLKRIYKITDERIASWERNELGYEVAVSEEDPDTLSYGVYTLWATFFLSH
jgi:hypothetical protein